MLAATQWSPSFAKTFTVIDRMGPTEQSGSFAGHADIAAHERSLDLHVAFRASEGPGCTALPLAAFVPLAFVADHRGAGDEPELGNGQRKCPASTERGRRRSVEALAKTLQDPTQG